MSDFAAEQLVPFLRNASLFSPLDDDSCARLADQMELRRFSIGETVFSEGDAGNDAWLVFSGRVRVLKLSDTGHPVTLATQNVGEVFGEQAILNDAPRSATVRAAEDSVLFRIERTVFENVLASVPRVRRYFEEFMQERAIRDFLRTATVLETLKPKDITGLLDRLEPREFPTDATIIQEGEQADLLFIIRSGHVRVVQKNGDSRERLLRTLGEGDCFGEWALIEDRTRTASVIATEPTRCFALSRNDFDQLFQSSPRLRERLARRLAMYRSVDELSAETPPVPAASKPSTKRPRKKQLALEPLKPSSPELPAEESNNTRADVLPVTQPGWLGRWPWVAQEDQSDCGAASLAMAARCYGARLSINRLRELANVGREGASLFSLAAAAEEIGFRPRGVETGMDGLAEVRLPAIAHWQSFHYVVVFEVDATTVTIGDPARGIVRLSHEAFMSGWAGRLLLLEPTAGLVDCRKAPSLRGSLRNVLSTPLTSGPVQMPASEVQTSEESSQTEPTTGLVWLAVLWLQTYLLLLPLRISLTDPFGSLAIALLVAAAIGVICQGAFAWAMHRFRVRIRSRITDALRRVPLKFFHTRNATSASIWLSDGESVAKMAGTVLGARVAIPGMIGALVLAWLPHPSSGWLTLGWGTVSVGVLVVGFAWTDRRVRMSRSQHLRSHSLIEELAGADPEPARVGATADLICDDLGQAADLSSLFDCRIGLATKVCQVLVALTGLLTAAAIFAVDRVAIDQRAIMEVLYPLVLAGIPMLWIAGRLSTLAAGRIALGRIEGLLESVPERRDNATAKQPERITGELELQSVSLQYNPAEEDVLSAITLTIPAGQTIAIAGRDGSGRSAFARLIQGHYPPTSGIIRVDGHELAELNADTWRRQLGVAASDTLLVSGTVGQNIAMSKRFDKDAVEEAARLAGADGFISRLPQGWNTLVGSVGVELSASQRQRIGIARALFGQPPILIFDEATDSLDDEQENRLWHDLHAVMAARTVLLVPHRLRAATLADHIIVLDGGIIAEQGTHEDLLESNGVYSFLWSQAQA